jgi:two-component system response regulator YesN
VTYPVQRNRYSSPLAARTKQYLDQHYRSPCVLRDIARCVGASEKSTTSAFRSIYGLSICQYVIRKRLAAAVQLLRVSDAKVSTIAELSGFRNLASFYRLFKKQYQIVPRSLRS